MEEPTSCPTKDPTQLVFQGQGLTVDPSCQSRCRLSTSKEGSKNHTTLGRIESTPYGQPGLTVVHRDLENNTEQTPR